MQTAGNLNWALTFVLTVTELNSVWIPIWRWLSI